MNESPQTGQEEGYDDPTGGWRWSSTREQPRTSEAGGWVWDDAVGGWRWGYSSGWFWDEAVGGWRWGRPGSGSAGWVWDEASGGWRLAGPAPMPWAQQAPPSRRGARAVTAVLAAVLVAAVVGAGLGNAAWRSRVTVPSGPAPSVGSPAAGAPTGGSFAQPPTPQPATKPSASPPSSSVGSTPGAVPATPAQVEAVGKQVAPALVDINTTLSYSQEQAAGTGIVLSSTGEILTNNHVINGETALQVTDIGNGRTYDAKVVGYSHADDIAVLQLVGASGLTKATIGSSSTLATGQPVVAIGNAGGTGGQPSITGGSITSLDQSITASDEGDGTTEQLNGLIQSNTAIQPGDSGGSLVNLAGHVIGMDTAASDGFSFQAGGRTTQGYSIPIDRALDVAAKIEAGQASSSIHVGASAFLGVNILSAGQGGPSSGSGATITKVIAHGAAADAGLVAGDTITAFGDRSVSSSSDLTDIIEGYHPGQSASVQYLDQAGQQHSAQVTLVSGPPS